MSIALCGCDLCNLFDGNDENRDPVFREPERPFIVKGEIERHTVREDEFVELIALAEDPDRDTVLYSWRASTDKNFNSDITTTVFKEKITGQIVTFATDNPFLENGPLKYWIRVTADDGRGGAIEGQLQVTVVPDLSGILLRISEPRNGDTVRADDRIKGTYTRDKHSRIPKAESIAVYIHNRETGEWLEYTDIAVDIHGNWIAYLGSDLRIDSEMEFDIGVKLKEGDAFHDIVTVTRE